MLSDELEPLAPVKSYLNVVTGMNVKTGNEQGHHAGTVGILSGCPMVSQPHPSSAYASTFSGPSIDQVAAEVIAGRHAVPLAGGGGLAAGDRKRGDHAAVPVAPRAPTPPTRPNTTRGRCSSACSAAAAGAPTALARWGAACWTWWPRMPGRSSRQLGAKDRRRMDQHLDDIREIERRVTSEWHAPGPLPVPGGPPGTVLGRGRGASEPHGGSTPP